MEKIRTDTIDRHEEKISFMITESTSSDINFFSFEYSEYLKDIRVPEYFIIFI